MYIMDRKLKSLNKLGVNIKRMSEILKISKNTIRKRRKKLNLSEYCEICGKSLTVDEKKYCKNCRKMRKKEMHKPSNSKYRFKILSNRVKTTNKITCILIIVDKGFFLFIIYYFNIFQN